MLHFLGNLRLTRTIGLAWCGSRFESLIVRGSINVLRGDVLIAGSGVVLEVVGIGEA